MPAAASTVFTVFAALPQILIPRWRLGTSSPVQGQIEKIAGKRGDYQG
jgi:hypothetical protein